MDRNRKTETVRDTDGNTDRETGEALVRDVREGYRKLTLALIRSGLTITTMESATAGQIASLITDTEGSSAVLKGAFVTYSNEAKILQGVPREIIERYGVYSAKTAEAMAKACRKAYGADIGIGVTGTMGNKDPENEDSVPGTLYYAIDCRGKVRSQKCRIPAMPTRLAYKMAAAGEVLKGLRRLPALGDKERENEEDTGDQ